VIERASDPRIAVRNRRFIDTFLKAKGQSESIYRGSCGGSKAAARGRFGADRTDSLPNLWASGNTGTKFDRVVEPRFRIMVRTSI
jgi:hypothetical protein